MPVEFYLGTHHAHWLGRYDVPMFLSRRTLAPRKSLPRALGKWALDSGGFTELSMHGAWTVTATQYVDEVRRYREEIGGLEWAAIQDWMCEPWILQKTGRTVEEHQRLSVASYVELMDAAPELPWTPVLQGWEPDDYFRHVEEYERAGVDLRRLPVVGVGSVCRRQHTGEAALFLRQLAGMGLHLHGFGFKVLGLERTWDVLRSSDSLAWSLEARRSPPLLGCSHKSCANCQKYALAWRGRLLRRIDGWSKQMVLPFDEASA